MQCTLYSHFRLEWQAFRALRRAWRFPLDLLLDRWGCGGAQDFARIPVHRSTEARKDIYANSDNYSDAMRVGANLHTADLNRCGHRRCSS